MNLQTLKGFRDFLPKEAKKREYVISTLKKVFELYGFEPLETPSLEYEEILTGKYGDEGDKLMYKFEDQGKRKVALRYDQTVPLARVVSQYQNDLPIPFKRYQIQNVWRAENTQKGRYREFIQCDVDTVGSSSLSSDAEIIAVAVKALEALGFTNYTVFINNRENLNKILGENISKEKAPAVIRALDKLKKIGTEKVIEEIVSLGFKKEEAQGILENVKNAKPDEGLNEVLLGLKEYGISDAKVKYLPTLARGLDYYTGTIFEIEIEGYEAGSVAGGGRFDNLIGFFAGKQIPAVGLAFGFDRLMETMESLGLFPKGMGVVKVLVTFNKKSLEISDKLRENGINTEVYLEEKDLEKQLKYADKKDIPYTIIFEGEKLILKDMIRRTQETLVLAEIISKLNVSPSK